MKRTLLIFLLFYNVVTICQTLKTFSIQEQTEDINYISSELKIFHPGIYTYQSEKEFVNGFESLKSSLKENQTVFEFYQQLVPVINNIGCGHTTVKLPKRELKKIEKNQKLLPIEISIINNRVYITKVLDNISTIQPGDEIISINNTPSTRLIEETLHLYPSDGRILSRKYQMMEKYFAIDYAKFSDSPDKFVLEIRNNKKTRKVELPGIVYEDFKHQTATMELKNMELEMIDSLSTALITIRNSSSGKIFSEFLEFSFLQIHSNGTQNLIIDLRYDSFNRDHDGAELYSYLTDTLFNYYHKLEVTENYDVPKVLRWITHYPIEQDSTGKYYWTIHDELNMQYPKPNPFLGNVFVLTDGFTFSATSEFSSIVKSNKRGLIVGMETGGGYYGNNSGGMLIRKLPNSQLKVVVPPIKYIMAVEDLGNYTRGVIPDVPIDSDINKVILCKDQILNTAIQLILQSQ